MELSNSLTLLVDLDLVLLLGGLNLARQLGDLGGFALPECALRVAVLLLALGLGLVGGRLAAGLRAGRDDVVLFHGARSSRGGAAILVE